MNGTLRRFALVVLALAATLVVGAFPALAASPPSDALPAAITASPSQAEPLPDMFYASAAIPSDKTQTDIYDRRVTPNSLIFLTVDTTAWPGPDLSLPGLEVTVRQAGFFEVATLDNSQAPPPGINFTYAVFNSFSFGGFTVGSGTIPAGVHKVGVPIAAARPTSAVILTVDRQLSGAASTLAAVPGVKLTNHGNGFITVTTLDDSAAPVPVPFNWLLFNTVTVPGRFPRGVSCQPMCGTGTIPVGVPNVAISNSSVTSPSGVLLTVDVTSYHRDIGVPGVKVNNHGSGFFTVTTDREQPVPSSASNGLPFQYLILQPPAAWEELGPTGRSGNTETIAADPADPAHTWYVGSVHAGVWKTTDSGDTWYQAWYNANHQILPLFGVDALAASPKGTVFALTEQGLLYESTDDALTWTEMASPKAQSAVSSNLLFRGVRIAADGSDTVYVCSDAGLWSLASGTSQWMQVGPANEGKCSDVVIDNGAVYAAFRGVGVVELTVRIVVFGGHAHATPTWVLLKAAARTSEFPDDPIRFALGPGSMLVSEGCDVCGTVTVWFDLRSNLSGPDPTATWGNPIATLPESTGGGPGYSISAAMSPSGRTLIAGGRGAWISNNQTGPNGGTTFHFRKIMPEVETGEMHQFLIFNDNDMVGVVDGGIRLSHDGGHTWTEAEHLSQNVDGPPVTEFCNVDVNCFSVSNPDQFGQVLAGGAVQDLGGIAVLDRPTGTSFSPGEFVISAVAPKPIDTSDSSGNPVSRLRAVATEAIDTGSGEGQTAKSVEICDFVVSGATDPNAGGAQDGYAPAPTCTKYRVVATTVDDSISAIGISQQSPDSILVGTAHGAAYRFVRGFANGEPGPVGFQQIEATNGDAVTAIGFATDTIAYVGHTTGAVTRITNPFGTVSAQPVPTGGIGEPVIGFAFEYGDPNQAYIAFKNDVVASTSALSAQPTFTDLLPCPTSPACFDLQTAGGVSGLVLDPDHPFLYMALGPGGVDDGNSVWRLALPANPRNWAPFSQGLPPDLKVTGLGIAPDKALYLATDGRGLFWRRDIASQTPNNGLDTPAYATVKTGSTFVLTTRCSYPTGWRHIRALDIKLARGHGPGDGDPDAAWLEFDGSRDELRLYNFDTRTWSEGRPGSAITLANSSVSLDLAHSSIAQVVGVSPPTVEIRWALILHRPAAGNLQQYVRVTDDTGASTSWDKVGDLRVTTPSGS